LAKCPVEGEVHKVPLTAYYEFEQVNRDLGRGSLHAIEGSGSISTKPVCMKQIPIGKEIDTIATSGSPSEAFKRILEEACKQVFNADRACKEWIQYTPGFSPKEHLVEEKVLTLEEMRKAQDERLSEMSRQVQENSRKIGLYTFWSSLIIGFVVLVFSATQTFILLFQAFPWFRHWLSQLGQ